MEYSRNFGSQFPYGLITPGEHKDIDDSVIDLVNKYNDYLKQKNVEAASELYNANKDILDPYIINMSWVNRIEEEVYNLSLVSVEHLSTIISDDEPLVDQVGGSYWLKEF